MRRWKRLRFSISCALALSVAHAHAFPTIFPITEDTMFMASGDSFNVEQFANRYSAEKESAYILNSPTNNIMVRDISRSGDDDLGGLTNRECASGYGLAWALQGTNRIVEQLYCSGNHIQPPFNTTGSNYTHSNMVTRLLWPMQVMNRFGVLTNAWPFSTNKIMKVVYSDAGYYQSNIDDTLSGTFLHCLGGSNAAYEGGFQYIDSYHMNLAVITNGHPGNSNLWFNAPNYDHPGNVIQLPRAVHELVAEGMDTNVFTVQLDASALTVTSTSHATFTGWTQNGNTWSGNLTPGRLSMGYDVGDNWNTNDSRLAFQRDAWIVDRFHEDVVINNTVNGVHVTSVNGVPVATNTVVNGTLHLNFFMITKGGIWDQKQQVVAGCRKMRDVSPLDASTYTGQTNISYYQSSLGQFWTNSADMNVYAANILTYAQRMYIQDATNHMLAQPRTFTISDQVVSFQPLQHMRLNFGANHYEKNSTGSSWRVSHNWGIFPDFESAIRGSATADSDDLDVLEQQLRQSQSLDIRHSIGPVGRPYFPVEDNSNHAGWSLLGTGDKRIAVLLNGELQPGHHSN
jgi:hypothetical protein